jgi:hypothetical protein
MEIVVDAYDEVERAMGWYYYLQDTLEFPFLCRCVEERGISPLEKGDEVEIIGMASEDECMREVFVTTRWGNKRGGLDVPLSQLEVIHGDDDTRRAVEDWRYWVARGYEF